MKCLIMIQPCCMGQMLALFLIEKLSDEDKSTVEGELKAAFDKLKGISLG